MESPSYVMDDVSTLDEKFASTSLSHLWEIFEDSQTTAKLILPDMKTIPFYLPPPKATKEIKDAQFAKDLRRFDFICQRESKNVKLTDRSGMMNSIPIMKLKGKELLVQFSI